MGVLHRPKVVRSPHLKFSEWLPSFYEQWRFLNVKIHSGTVFFIQPKIAREAHLHIAVQHSGCVSTAMRLAIVIMFFYFDKKHISK